MITYMLIWKAPLTAPGCFTCYIAFCLSASPTNNNNDDNDYESFISFCIVVVVIGERERTIYMRRQWDNGTQTWHTLSTTICSNSAICFDNIQLCNKITITIYVTSPPTSSFKLNFWTSWILNVLVVDLQVCRYFFLTRTSKISTKRHFRRHKMLEIAKFNLSAHIHIHI